jgi:hypothetical protein
VGAGVESKSIERRAVTAGFDTRINTCAPKLEKKGKSLERRRRRRSSSSSSSIER